MIVPLRDAGKDVTRDENKCPNASAVATAPEFLAVANLTVESGRFLVNDDMENDRTVCVLGASVAQQLFKGRSPLGESISIGGKIFRVVGGAKCRGTGGGKGLGIDGARFEF